MVNSYSDVTTLKSRLGLAETTFEDEELLQEALDWATETINSFCDRTFGDPITTRYYHRDAGYNRSQNLDPRDPHLLYLDYDFTSVSQVINGDGTVISAADYVLEPRNAPAESKPYYAIRLLSSLAWVWPTDGWVAVTASWGYSSTPDPLIVGSCLRLAEYWYRSKEPILSTTLFDGTTKTEKPAGFPTDVMTELEQRKRLAP